MHEYEDKFDELIGDCARRTRIGHAMIEKDYFVTLFLKHLFEAEPNIIFKGGTCLSKCYRLIDRFSEDIDLTMRPDATQKQKKGLKYHIIDVADKLGLEHTNADKIDSGRAYAQHNIRFPSNYTGSSLKPFLLVETFFRRTASPALLLPASSLLYDHLKDENSDEVISKFDLGPFDVTVQSLQVTFIDKLHSLNSNSLRGRINAYSRHLYDIHKILPHIRFDGEFFRLLKEIGEHERKAVAAFRVPIDLDPSALTASLRNVISDDVYKNDYETTTFPLLFVKVPYEDTIRSLGTALDEIDAEEGEFAVEPQLNFLIRARRTAKA
ncbi:MAG: nucleotidyl transferase AbiEii/AbiGii toxin family protein [Methanomassiliicoccaceae archaeon]|nr:nucleotidyl transferase AbiEii/AbiGii toxin family protein [Methanomassiliicoccaceae archaeon]